MKNKTTALLVMILMVSIIFTGCSLFQVNPERAAEKVVATVNGRDIKQGELDGMLVGFIAYYERTDSKFFTTAEGKELLNNAQKQMLDVLIQQEVIMQKAQEMNITVTDEEINTQYKELEDLYGEQLQQYMQEEKMTEEVFKENIIRIELTFEKVREAVSGDVVVTDDDVLEYYEKNIEEFKTMPDMVSASHVLVETKEEAEEVIAKYKAGAEFSDLAQESSLCPSGVEGGSLGYFGRGEMVAEFEEVAFALEPGVISEPVQTIHGFHVIMVDDKIEGEILPFEDIKDYLKDYLINQEKDKIFEDKISDWEEESDIKKFLK